MVVALAVAFTVGVLPRVWADLSVGAYMGSFFATAAVSNALISCFELGTAAEFVVKPMVAWWVMSWGDFLANSFVVDFCVLHYCGCSCWAQPLARAFHYIVAFVCGPLHGAFIFVRRVLHLSLGFFCSANRCSFIWHSIAYWSYIIVGLANGMWYIFSSNPSDPQKAVMILIVALVLLGWIKLAGDIEEKSKIVIFSERHISAMFRDGRGLASRIIFKLFKLFVGLFYGVIGLVVGWIQSRRYHEISGPELV